MPTSFGGDSLVTVLSPTGLKHISPHTSRKYRPTSHQKLTLPCAVNTAAGIINRYATPIKSMPNVNFTGLDGCRSRSRTQRIENTGVSMMTKAGVSDCRYGAGNFQPNNVVSTSLSAKRL